MTAEFAILNFDTEIFGFKTAKILSPRLSAVELQAALMQLGAQDVRLVYWPSDSADSDSQNAARQLQGFLCSQQANYVVDLRSLPPSLAVAARVKIFESKESNEELENLAIQAGNYSRFKVDPKFPYDLFFKLYTAWMRNSLTGIAADCTMVVWSGDEIAGMVTAGRKKDYGYIGLLAVSQEHRGRSVGTMLVSSAQAYLRSNGLLEGRVATQLSNKPACHLYEKCGFKVDKIENIYHFWL